MILDYEIIYVMSGGKTGSQTLTSSFSRLHSVTIHTHDSSEAIHSTRLGKKILIVNSYREPISRHISSFLFTLNKTNKRYLMNDTGNLNIVKGILECKLQFGDFFENYHPLKDFLDYFDKPLIFNREQKWHFQKNIVGAADCLMLRFDQINNWENQIRTIFPRFRIIPNNLTDTKSYSRFYKYFKSNYRPSDLLLSTLAKDHDLLTIYYEKSDMMKIITYSCIC